MKMRERIDNILSPDISIYSETPVLPGKMALELNNTCNYSCVFCPFHSKYLNKADIFNPTHMNIEMAKAILEQARSLLIGRDEVALFGRGEIYLYENFDEVIKYAKDLGFSYVYITTNGSLADLENIKKTVDAGIDSIRFSINAGQKETYKLIHGKDYFDVVMNNIENAVNFCLKLKNKPNLSVSFVKTSLTNKETDLLINRLKGYIDDIVIFDAANLWQISHRLEDKYAEQSLYTDRTNNERTVCGYIFNTLFINSMGEVCLCCAGNKTVIPFFNLNNELDLKKAWYCEGLTNYRRILLNGHSKGTICEKCYYRYNNIGIEP